MHELAGTTAAVGRARGKINECIVKVSAEGRKGKLPVRNEQTNNCTGKGESVPCRRRSDRRGGDAIREISFLGSLQIKIKLSLYDYLTALLLTPYSLTTAVFKERASHNILS